MGALGALDLTLPVVLGAALIDSINPCAFAVLLTFIAATLVLAERASATGPGARWLLWRLGLVYVGGIFVTYLGLGLGLLSFATSLGQTHWVGRTAAVGAMLLGLLALQEALVPEWGSRLTVPAGLHGRLKALSARATVPAAFAAGVLVGLCTVPCSGAVYLAVLGLLASQATYLEGVGYLVLYNLVFVLPLVVMLALAGSRPVFNRLGRWQLHHREALKGGLGVTAIGLGIVLLETL
ncbi:MAG: cytochrome C biogenesis protein [Chloroflexi bacterium]|nr:cytochrome C biogenesis protein [Chloroflexota bacterium]